MFLLVADTFLFLVKFAFGNPTEFFSSVVFFNPRISRFIYFCFLMISITLIVIVTDRVTRHAALRGVTKSQTQLSN